MRHKKKDFKKQSTQIHSLDKYCFPACILFSLFFGFSFLFIYLRKRDRERECALAAAGSPPKGLQQQGQGKAGSQELNVISHVMGERRKMECWTQQANLKHHQGAHQQKAGIWNGARTQTQYSDMARRHHKKHLRYPSLF